MSVTAAEGFVAAGVACGIKEGGVLDLAIVATEDGVAVPAAGVFTANLAAAAPVQVSRAHLGATGGRASAVVLNSGNANAATGEAGVLTAEQMCAMTAKGVGCPSEDVLVCSTGLIGIPLPVGPIETGIPAAVSRLAGDGAADAAEAIRTTDTVRKEIVVEGEGFTVGGMAKGAAMLAPNMATMLAVLTTDAAAEPAALRAALVAAVDATFNSLSVDGCTSTNDTVLLLASGRRRSIDGATLAAAVHDACASLARQMAADAEGATKLARIRVKGATSDAEALRAARQVAQSQLVKCSLYGEDPYWGRIVSELGVAGVHFEVGLVAVSYGDEVVCAGGVAVEHDAATVKAHLAQREITVTADLGLGTGDATVITTDLTHAYIDENMRTS